ncbi:MAG: type II CRISPR-associated endonuclease Cas1 [Chlorobi bacterium]|jgi:CRISPR-associated protein Cas1|nr:type II CRISPR-associated endonuclease Cas1 [Chlorobiota bacterium]
MLKRTIVIASPSYLRLEYDQLLIENTETGVIAPVPIEDVGYLILEHRQITLTHPVLTRCLEHGVAVVVCDAAYLPAGMFLHLGQQHHIQGERFLQQVAATPALQETLWQQTVRAKILNQAILARRLGVNTWRSIERLATRVQPGDRTNCEATAARHYWRGVFGNEFSRDPDGDPPNNLLNYGYTIVRAATARALVTAGLLPILGIHHRNRSNCYALADDVMEPYRPFVDGLVWELCQQTKPPETLTPSIKRRLLEVLTLDTIVDGQRSPLQIALATTAASLAYCFAGSRSTIIFPRMPE